MFLVVSGCRPCDAVEAVVMSSTMVVCLSGPLIRRVSSAHLTL